MFLVRWDPSLVGSRQRADLLTYGLQMISRRFGVKTQLASHPSGLSAIIKSVSYPEKDIINIDTLIKCMHSSLPRHLICCICITLIPPLCPVSPCCPPLSIMQILIHCMTARTSQADTITKKKKSSPHLCLGTVWHVTYVGALAAGGLSVGAEREREGPIRCPSRRDC